MGGWRRYLVWDNGRDDGGLPGRRHSIGDPHIGCGWADQVAPSVQSLLSPQSHPPHIGTALLAPHSAGSRFSLSTSGWEPVTPGSPPLRFRFFANYARGSPVPLRDLGSSTVAAGILLSLSVADNQGEVEVTVQAIGANGCGTTVSPGVTVTLAVPSLTSLAEAYSSANMSDSGSSDLAAVGDSAAGRWVSHACTHGLCVSRRDARLFSLSGRSSVPIPVECGPQRYRIRQWSDRFRPRQYRCPLGHRALGVAGASGM
jgi:hypothetical protein